MTKLRVPFHNIRNLDTYQFIQICNSYVSVSNIMHDNALQDNTNS